jgi:hypothetical protein
MLPSGLTRNTLLDDRRALFNGVGRPSSGWARALPVYNLMACPDWVEIIQSESTALKSASTIHHWVWT